MVFPRLTNLVKINCIFILLISFAQGIPIPQYDNVEYVEITEYDEVEEQDEPAGHGEIPVVPAGPENPETGSKAALFKLPENYSVHKSPPLINGEPIPVECSMLIFNVFDIKEMQEEVSMEVNLKLYWKDLRLMNWTLNIDPGQKYTVLSQTLLHRIWHPDIFIDHIKRVTQPSLISPAASLRIYKDGSLRYTARMLIVLTCRMDFHYYPADTQECKVALKSFTFSTKHIKIAWRDGIGALLAKSIDVHNFDVALETHPDYLQQTKSNNYTGLSFGVRLRRKLSYHIIQTYVPSTLFTIVSWLSFLIPPDSTPGRMAICVTTLLTVTAMFGSVKQNTPNVSYVKAIDVWMFMCIVFIFLSLAEFTVVLKLRSKKEKPKKEIKPKVEHTTELKPVSLTESKTEEPVKSVNNEVVNNGPVDKDKVVIERLIGNNSTYSLPRVIVPKVPVIPPPAPPPPGPPKPTKYFMMATKIEKYAPRVAPLLFIGFACFYFPYLIIASEYYELSTDPDMYYTVPAL